MKAIFAIALISLAAQAQARSLNFACTPGNEKVINSFRAQGKLETSEPNSVSGVVSIELIEVGNKSNSLSIAQDSVSGSFTVISAGHLSIAQVTSLSLQAASSPLHATINLGLKGPTSSSLLADGISYKAECSEVR